MEILTDRSKINSELWRVFVSTHPQGNFFQTPDAFSFFLNIPNYQPFIIAIIINDEIIALLSGVNLSEKGLKSTFSKRTIVWGGPLIQKNSEKYINILFEKLKEISKNSIYTEIRNLFNTENLKAHFLNNGFKYKSHLNYVITITDEEHLFKHLSKSKLRQIRNSLKNGAEITIAETMNDVRAFYTILSDLFREKVKKPLPAFEFFEKFFCEKNLGKIFLVKHSETVIGGILCPVYEEKIIYEWYVGAKDNEVKGIYPSVLATWAPIKYAVDHGLKYFDFMGAGSPDTDYGVREFKSKFGGQLIENGRYIRINKPLLFIAGKTGLKILGKLNLV